LTNKYQTIKLSDNLTPAFSESLLLDNYKDLCDIAAAIEQKDFASARQIAEKHVTKFNDLVEKNLNG